MKKLRVISIALVTALITIFALASCTIIQSQKMKNVVGTYELTHYTYRPEYENGKKAPATIDYVRDRGYKDYLVVTGSSTGYYVHSDNNTAAYSIPVTLSYEYDQEDSSKVSYVIYKFPNSTDENRFGVTKDSLNYSTIVVTTQGIPAWNIPGKVTEDLSKSWHRVDDAIDLSFVKTKFDTLREHTAETYAVEGIYQMSNPTWEVQGEQTANPENPYHYYYVVLDPIAMNATVAYLETAEGSVAVKKPETVTLVDGWNTFKVGNVEWKKDAFGMYYHVIIPVEGATDGSSVNWEMISIYHDLSETYLNQLITDHTPIPSETHNT